jgi:hypothetical protein
MDSKKGKFIQTLKMMLPMMFGILLLVSLITTVWSSQIPKIFSGNIFLDPLLGALAGSISFGIPLTSYVVGGELLAKGVSLIAVTAFVMAWTTVGVAMLPIEARFLGKSFAIRRNIINFVFSILVAISTVATLKIFHL